MGKSVKRLLLIGLVVLVGCGARKKELHESKSKYTYDASIDSAVNFQELLEKKKLELINQNRNAQSFSIEYEGCEGDSLSFEEFGSDGQLLSKAIIKGKGKGKLSRGNESETTQKTIDQSEKKEIDLQASKTAELKGSGSSSEKQLEVDKKGSFALSWWWLLVVTGVLLVYLNYRFKWFSRFKKYVLNNNPGDDNFA